MREDDGSSTSSSPGSNSTYTAASNSPPHDATAKNAPLDEPAIVEYPDLGRFKFLRQMGEGAFSLVYEALDRQMGYKVAVKVLEKARLHERQRANILREVTLLKRLDHPNIVKLIDFLDTPIHYAIVMELMSGGEVFHQLVTQTCFSESVCRHIITQVAAGIHHLHVERGIVHRDIKLENLLFEPPNPHRAVAGIAGLEERYTLDEDYDTDAFLPGVGGAGVGLVKIADFGLSKVVFDTTTKTPCGTVGYTAPEILRDERYSKGVDMWALGCVLYTLLSGFPPFFDDSPRGLAEKVACGQYSFLSPWWDDISVESKDVVSRLLEVNPRKRLTIDEFLNHPWVLGKRFGLPRQVNPSLLPPNALALSAEGARNSTAETVRDSAGLIAVPKRSHSADTIAMSAHTPPAADIYMQEEDRSYHVSQIGPLPVQPLKSTTPTGVISQDVPEDELLLPQRKVSGWKQPPVILRTPADDSGPVVNALDESDNEYFPLTPPVNPTLAAARNSSMIQTPLTLPSPAFIYPSQTADSIQPARVSTAAQPSPLTTPSVLQPDGKRMPRRTPLPLPDGVTREVLAAPFNIYQSLADNQFEGGRTESSAETMPIEGDECHGLGKELRGSAMPIGKILGGVVPSPLAPIQPLIQPRSSLGGTPGGTTYRKFGGGRQSGAFDLDIQRSMLFNKRTGA